MTHAEDDNSEVIYVLPFVHPSAQWKSTQSNYRRTKLKDPEAAAERKHGGPGRNDHAKRAVTDVSTI